MIKTLKNLEDKMMTFRLEQRRNLATLDNAIAVLIMAQSVFQNPSLISGIIAILVSVFLCYCGHRILRKGDDE